MTSATLLPFVAARRPQRVQLPVLIAVAAFLFDLNTPSGIADGFFYVAAVLMCVWMPATNAALYTALGLVCPMILGFVLSPTGAPLRIALLNRCIALALIWLAALVVWRNAREKERTIEALKHQLQGAERAAEQERTALSDWLKQDISPELMILDWRLNSLSGQLRRGVALRNEAQLLRRAIQRTSLSVHGKVDRLQKMAH